MAACRLRRLVAMAEKSRRCPAKVLPAESRRSDRSESLHENLADVGSRGTCKASTENPVESPSRSICVRYLRMGKPPRALAKEIRNA